MTRRLGFALVLLITWSCAPEEVVVWSMPPAGGSAGSAPMGGSGGTSAGSGGSLAGAVSATAGTTTVGGAGGSGDTAVGGAGGEAGSSSDCMTNADCEVSWLCAKVDCGASGGVCEPRPVFCPPEPTPVCGCDGVTYWNDCVRRQSGALAATPGECRAGAMPCDKGADCGVQNATCARFVPPDQPCDSDVPGVCWVAPAVCEPTADALRWHECGPNAPDPPPCMDTCEAIVRECAVVPVHHDYECQ